MASGLRHWSLRVAQVWWEDDSVTLSQNTTLQLRGLPAVTLLGGVPRPPSFATTGAVLYDGAWMTERDLQGALHNRKIVAHPELHSLPGWESVHKALETDRRTPQ